MSDYYQDEIRKQLGILQQICFDRTEAKMDSPDLDEREEVLATHLAVSTATPTARSPEGRRGPGVRRAGASTIASSAVTCERSTGGSELIMTERYRRRHAL